MQRSPGKAITVAFLRSPSPPRQRLALHPLGRPPWMALFLLLGIPADNEREKLSSIRRPQTAADGLRRRSHKSDARSIEPAAEAEAQTRRLKPAGLAPGVSSDEEPSLTRWCD